MLTRKEQLFVKPFQRRLYRIHKMKVKSATARIDTTPPREYHHIITKKKKSQMEQERCSQILINNSILWQHLCEIMKTKRVDDRWDYEQPKFFHRIKLFKKNENKLIIHIEEPVNYENMENIKNKRCYACNPNLSISKVHIPEEKIPWNPPKKNVSKQIRKNSSVHSNKDIKSVKCQKSEETSISKKQVDNKLNVNNITIETNNYLNYIEINEGSLDVVIKFPSGSKVAMINGKTKNVLQLNNLQCTQCLSYNTKF
ncbi:Hemingway/KIAA1430 [Cinara cedri]|uniref:Hemingway/KIAA1430 n=1 Tax=Cinara cedri TaxID=506608 RepID=A0A5E4M178_9HEMI|nr:Hemingway/KIAA1430 [Cinara cedri]